MKLYSVNSSTKMSSYTFIENGEYRTYYEIYNPTICKESWIEFVPGGIEIINDITAKEIEKVIDHDFENAFKMNDIGKV